MAEQTRQLLAELELVRRLEEAWLSQHNRWDPYDLVDANQAYANAFRGAGLDVENLAVKEAAARLRRHPRILVVLATQLTEWAFLRRANGDETSMAKWRHLARTGGSWPSRSIREFS